MADASKRHYLQGLQHIKPALKLSSRSNILVLEKKRVFLLLTRGAGVFPCAHGEQ